MVASDIVNNLHRVGRVITANEANGIEMGLAVEHGTSPRDPVSLSGQVFFRLTPFSSARACNA